MQGWCNQQSQGADGRAAWLGWVTDNKAEEKGIKGRSSREGSYQPLAGKGS